MPQRFLTPEASIRHFQSSTQLLKAWVDLIQSTQQVSELP